MTAAWLSRGLGLGPSITGFCHCSDVPSRISRVKTSLRYLQRKISSTVLALIQHKATNVVDSLKEAPLWSTVLALIQHKATNVVDSLKEAPLWSTVLALIQHKATNVVDSLKEAPLWSTTELLKSTIGCKMEHGRIA